jgi:hypothetical protein
MDPKSDYIFRAVLRLHHSWITVISSTFGDIQYSLRKLHSWIEERRDRWTVDLNVTFRDTSHWMKGIVYCGQESLREARVVLIESSWSSNDFDDDVAACLSGKEGMGIIHRSMSSAPVSFRVHSITWMWGKEFQQWLRSPKTSSRVYLSFKRDTLKSSRSLSFCNDMWITSHIISLMVQEKDRSVHIFFVWNSESVEKRRAGEIFGVKSSQQVFTRIYICLLGWTHSNNGWTQEIDRVSIYTAAAQ